MPDTTPHTWYPAPPKKREGTACPYCGHPHPRRMTRAEEADHRRAVWLAPMNPTNPKE